jgi:AcrR family transcriptional regulator
MTSIIDDELIVYRRRMEPDGQGQPPSRRARRRVETRARLVAAAAALFADQGVERTAIAQITETADLGFGAFYNYFPSKEALVEATLNESLGALDLAIDTLTGGLDDPAEIVAVGHRHLVAQATADVQLAWLLVRLDASHRAMVRGLRERARRDLQRGIADHRFDVTDPETAFFTTTGALILVMRAVLDGELSAEAGNAHAEAVLRILGVAPADAAEIARRPLRVA